MDILGINLQSLPGLLECRSGSGVGSGMSGVAAAGGCVCAGGEVLSEAKHP